MAIGEIDNQVDAADFKSDGADFKSGPGGSSPTGANVFTDSLVMIGEQVDAHKDNEYVMTESEVKKFKVALRGNLVCSSLNDSESWALAEKAELFVYAAGEEVITQGERGSHFFVVLSGEFEVKVNDETVNRLGVGDTFGEISLIHNCARSATVISVTDGRIWGVARTHFRRTVRHLCRRNFQENMKFLDCVEVFQYLTEQQKNLTCQALTVQIYAPGADVVREGEGGDSIYIVKTGTLVVTVGDREIRRLGPGDYFGERALLYNQPRSATVRVCVRSTCLSLKRRTVEQCLGSLSHVLFRNVMLISFKENSAVFTSFTAEQLQRLVEATTVKDFPAKAVVTSGSADSQGLRFFVVLDGEVTVRGPDDTESRHIRRGEVFGDEYVCDLNRPFNHVVENSSAFMACKLAFLYADAITSLLDSGIVEKSFNLDEKKAVLRKVYVFRHLSNHQCNLLVKSFRTIKRQQGEHVITEGELGSQFFVIHSGELLVTKVIDGHAKTLRTLGKFDYFGERGLLFNEPRTATVMCDQGEAELWVIDKTLFLQIVEGAMLAHLEERIRLQDTNFALDDLRDVQVVGRGTFGVVKLVEHKNTGTQYALKCVSRVHAVQQKQEDHLLLERWILLENDHPFIVKLVRTFKDRRFVYFLTELVTGGELYSAIRKIGLLKPAQVAFYTGSLFLALESLIERSIVYRDLKPENVLLDSQGYIKLIDFGCAKKLRRKGMTCTLVGTPHYIAPEVILGKGYNYTCDIWSMGVCMYEFVCGPLPFGSDSNDHMDVFREILTAQLVFPSVVTDHAAMLLMKRLLCRQPDARIGCGPSPGALNEIRRHPFFRDFSWDALLGRTLKAPLVPESEEYEKEDSSREELVIGEMAIDEENGWDKDF